MSNVIVEGWEELSESQIKALVKKEMEELYGKNIANDIVDEQDKKRVDDEITTLLQESGFNLDLALDTYDPTFPRYEPSADAFEFYNLMRLVNGEDFEFNTPIAHYFMADLLLGHIKDVRQFPYSLEVCDTLNLDILRIGFMCSRGMAKSTVVISFFSVYSAIKGELPNGIGKVWFYLLLAASSRGGARVNALAVRAMCEDSVFLNEYFEEMRFTETESEFIRKGSAPRKNRGFLIRYQGINTGVRGSRYGERRPCCHVRGTIVTTEYGVYPVEQHPGYKSEGHWEECTEVQVRGMVGKEVVSKDHSYLAKVCVGNKCIVENGKKLARYSEHPAKWVKASDLTDRHWIGEAIDYEIKNPVQEFKIKVSAITDRKVDGTVLKRSTQWKSVHIDELSKPEFWWLYGLWLGDGTLGTGTTINYIVADTQRDVVGKKIYECAKAIGMHVFEPSCQLGNGCHTLNASFKDGALYHWLKKQKGGNSIKTMPDWVLKIDPELQKQILLGYIAADGYIDIGKRNNQVRINSVNYDVLRQLQKIASRLGLPTHIRNTKQEQDQYFASTGKIHRVHHQWELRLKENCESVLGIKGIVNSTRIKHKQVHISDGILWRQVKQIRDTDEKYELIPIQCNNNKLEKICGTVHAYETEFGVSKNCIIFDDAILNTAAAYSKPMSDTLDEIIHSDSTNALKGGGRGRVILCFTPFHYGDVNTKALLNGAFTQCVIPIAKSFDAEEDITARDIESSWEAMHPAVSISKLVRDAKKAKKLRAFLQERMLRLTSGSDRLVPESCIQWLDMRTVEKNISAYNIYITTDYTTTSGEGSDFSGRATWAVNSNEDWFLLDLRLRKQTMDEQYKDTLQEANKWLRRGRHVEIGVEVDGNQNAHIYSLEKMMLDTSTWATFARQKNNPNPDKKGILSRSTGVKKHERFRIAVNNVLLPKKMWFPLHLKDTPDMQEFISQIRGATHSQFTRADDGPDLITMAVVSMEVVYPSVSVDEDVTTKITSDGLIWSSSFEEDMDELNTGNRSTVF